MVKSLTIALLVTIIAVFAIQVLPLGIQGHDSLYLDSKLPELVVVAAEVSTKSLLLGGNHTINILVNNTGDATAIFDVNDAVILVTSSLEHDVIIITGKKLIALGPDGRVLRRGEIAPGDSIFMKLKWTPIKDGTHNLNIFVDPTDMILEKNDTNNGYILRAGVFTDILECGDEVELKRKRSYGLYGNRLRIIDVLDNSTKVAVNTAYSEIYAGETIEVGPYKVGVLEIIPERAEVKVRIVACPEVEEEFTIIEQIKPTGEVAVEAAPTFEQSAVGEVEVEEGPTFVPGTARSEEE